MQISDEVRLWLVIEATSGASPIMKFLFMVFLLSSAAFANEQDQKHVPAEWLRGPPANGQLPEVEAPETLIANQEQIDKEQQNGRPSGQYPQGIQARSGSLEWQSHLIDPVLQKYNGNVRRSLHHDRPLDLFNAWKDNRQYQYDVRMRSLSSMKTDSEKTPGKWVGVEFRATLVLRVLNKNRLRGSFRRPAYAHIHDYMPAGFNSKLPQNVKFEAYPRMEKEFEVEMSGGLVKEVFVNPQMTMEDENLLKGILGTLQVDTSDRNMVKEPRTYYNEKSTIGVYKKMEQDVTGRCETLYSISPLEINVLQTSQHLAPYVNIEKLKGERNSRLVDISKTKNYGNCDKRIAYNFGVPQDSNWESPANDLVRRSNVQRIVCDPRNNTIYSSYTLETFLANPLMRGENTAVVMSGINMTLLAVDKQSAAANQIGNIRSAGSLLYSMGSKKRVSLDYTKLERRVSDAERLKKLNDDINAELKKKVNEPNQNAKSRQRRSANILDDVKNGATKFVTHDIPEFFGIRHPDPAAQPATPGQQNPGSATNNQQPGAPGQQIPVNSNQQSGEKPVNSDKKHSIIQDFKEGVDHIVQNHIPTFGFKKRSGGANQQSGTSSPNSNEQHSSGTIDSNESSNYRVNPRFRFKDGQNLRQNEPRSYDDSRINLSESESCESKESDIVDGWFDHPEINSASVDLVSILNMKPKSYQEMVKMINDISRELENPNNMPKMDTMSRINVLVDWLSMLNTKELQEIGKMVNKAGNAPQVKYPWNLFLNTVTQTGSNSAFTYIKQLILDGLVKGEQANRLISVMAQSVRTPTKRLLIDFFNLAFDSRVRNQTQLHNTVLLASTRLINMAYVNEQTSHDRYPIHLYGRFIPKQDKIVTREVLPVLAQELNAAVNKKDSHKIIVYSRAIGNLGHPAILKVFAKYIEQQVPVTSYERLMMVMSLEQLAHNHPSQARYALFNIYNSRDSYEIRVAAIFQLWKSKPTANMLHQMALDSHNDRSKEVRAAIKSAITYAAGLGISEKKFEELSRNAKAVVGLLTEENFGFQHSAKYLDYYFSKYLGVGNLQSLAMLGSEDSKYHKLFSYVSRMNFGGWMNRHKVEASVSSLKKLYQVLVMKLVRAMPIPQGEKPKGNLTPDDIAKAFNIKGNELLEALQGSILVELFNQQRIFTLNEGSINSYEQVIQKFVDYLKNGLRFDSQNFFNEENVDISFPTITGMPFYLRSKNPVYMHLKGDSDFKLVDDPKNGQLNVTGRFHGVYANDFDGRVGFYCPLGQKYMASGVINKFQLNIPIEYKINVDTFRVKTSVLPLNPNEDVTVFFDTRDSYTTMLSRDSTTVPSKDKNTHFIKPLQPKHRITNIYGKESIGMAFEVKSIYDVEPKRNPLLFSLKDSVIALFYPNFAKVDNNGANFIRFLPKESQNRRADFVFDFNTFQPKQNIGRWSTSNEVVSQLPSEITVGNGIRQEQMLNKAVEGIIGGASFVVDVGVEFSEKKHAQFAFTVAHGSSDVDEKTRTIFFYNHNTANGSPFQLYGSLGTTYPFVPTLNFKKSLETVAFTTYDMAINYGKQANKGATINVEGRMEQSKERRQYLLETPMVKLCQAEMAKGHYLNSACDNSTISANMMDKLNLKIRYHNIGNDARYFISQMYGYVKYYYYLNIRDNWFKTPSTPGLIEVSARLNLDLTRLNATINAPTVDIGVNNLALSFWGAKFVAVTSITPTHKPLIFEVYGGGSTCNIDQIKVTSFSNKTYTYPIKGCWHVAMQNGSRVVDYNKPEILSSNEQTLVLVRGNGKQKEFRISYKFKTGDNLIVQYAQGKIVVNGKQETISENKYVSEWSKHSASYKLMDGVMKQGEMMIWIDYGQLLVITDGERMRIIGGDAYLNSTRGFCGAMTGDLRTDLIAPNDCYMSDDSSFGPLWAVTSDSQCSAEVKELQAQAKKETCVRFDGKPVVNIAIPQEPKHEVNDQKPKVTVVGTTKANCHLQHSSQYEIDDKNNRICITTMPQPACTENCVSGDTYIKEVERICKPLNDHKFSEYVKQIDAGMNIEFPLSEKANDRYAFELPRICSK